MPTGARSVDEGGREHVSAHAVVGTSRETLGGTVPIHPRVCNNNPVVSRGQPERVRHAYVASVADVTSRRVEDDGHGLPGIYYRIHLSLGSTGPNLIFNYCPTITNGPDRSYCS